MFPKIQHKKLQNKETLYPKNTLSNKLEKQNNISQLKKLREFLQSKQIQQSQPVFIDREHKNISVMSTIHHLSNENISQTGHIRIEKLDRFKNNTSDISRRKKVHHAKQNSVNLRILQETSQKSHNFQKQKLRLREILDYNNRNGQSQQIVNNFAKCKFL